MPSGVYDRGPACRKGHPRTEDNAYYDNVGARQCKACRKLRALKHNSQHREEIRNRTTLYRYNLSLDDIQRMVLDQGGRCAICEKVLKKPYVDHNHSTNEVRGILCCSCNTALGKFQDDPKILRQAANYLEEI